MSGRGGGSALARPANAPRPPPATLLHNKRSNLNYFKFQIEHSINYEPRDNSVSFYCDRFLFSFLFYVLRVIRLHSSGSNIVFNIFVFLLSVLCVTLVQIWQRRVWEMVSLAYIFSNYILKFLLYFKLTLKYFKVTYYYLLASTDITYTYYISDFIIKIAILIYFHFIIIRYPHIRYHSLRTSLKSPSSCDYARHINKTQAGP